MSAASSSAARHVLAAAIALTMLNALKPLTEDDPSYYLHVRQVAGHPLDPYGGELYFRERLGPAVHNVAPPVPTYWLALGARASGGDPRILKLWLLPFAVLFAAMTFLLLRRFARGFERPGVWLLALSPAILPSLNLMTDVPAVALSLAAITCFWSASDRDSLGRALAAGLIAGLAIQTKYTGFSVLGVVMLIGWMRGRLRLAVVACAVAVACFLGWEAWVHARYGESQFFFFLGRRERGETGPTGLALVRPLVRTLGPLAAALLPLGLLALGAGRRWVIGAMVTVVAVHLVFGLAPLAVDTALARLPGGHAISLYNLTLGWLGPVLFAIVAAVIWRLSVRRRSLPTRVPAPRWRRDPDTLFVAAWLAIEIVAYLGISTYPAARRMLGAFVVLNLVIARLASRSRAIGGVAAPAGARDRRHRRDPRALLFRRGFRRRLVGAPHGGPHSAQRSRSGRRRDLVHRHQLGRFPVLRAARRSAPGGPRALVARARRMAGDPVERRGEESPDARGFLSRSWPGARLGAIPAGRDPRGFLPWHPAAPTRRGLLARRHTASRDPERLPGRNAGASPPAVAPGALLRPPRLAELVTCAL
mgnify:CR=1 FL=1